MNKLLSICVPTFNRAEELNKQLDWLAREIKGFENECEIIVSDNCSTDNTQEMIQKWQQFFEPTIQFTANKNSENIGWMKNFAYCLTTAIGKYTWTIGDDDLIYDGTLSFVLKTLKEKPELTLFYLNFLGRDRETGAILGEHWFDTSFEKDISEGKAIFQHHISQRFGSVIFITSTIYRTDLAQLALRKWPESVNNWGGFAYWTGFCAAHGSVLITKENYVECTMGASYWQKDPKALFRIRHQDIPEVYVKLQEIGYSRRFCSRRIMGILKSEFIGDAARESFLLYLKSFKNWPFWTMVIVSSFMALVVNSAIGLNASESEAVAVSRETSEVSRPRERNQTSA